MQEKNALHTIFFAGTVAHVTSRRAAANLLLLPRYPRFVTYLGSYRGLESAVETLVTIQLLPRRVRLSRLSVL
jgi:hypothetical protein